ncbi:MAG TPA: hypothetical protein VK835_07345 [Bacteroidia bacterium]|jgi:hypothetical protein|nr:hypothetical protein [Bacteroidia bacterium]
MTAKNKLLVIKFVLSCFFILTNLYSYSQDLIITRDSLKIFCEITKEDSATIYYKQVKGDAVFNFNIKKSVVLKYYNSSAIVQNQVRQADSLALTRKNDSIQFLKELSVRAITDSTFFKNDSLFLKNNFYFYHGKAITRNKVLDLMKGNDEANHEMHNAMINHRVARFIAYLGAGLAGAGCANLIFDKSGALAEVGVGVGMCLISIPIVQITVRKHINKALKSYNSKLGIAGTTIPKFEIGMASRGLGVSIKF